MRVACTRALMSTSDPAPYAMAGTTCAIAFKHAKTESEATDVSLVVPAAAVDRPLGLASPGSMFEVKVADLGEE